MRSENCGKDHRRDLSRNALCVRRKKRVPAQRLLRPGGPAVRRGGTDPGPLSPGPVASGPELPSDRPGGLPGPPRPAQGHQPGHRHLRHRDTALRHPGGHWQRPAHRRGHGLHDRHGRPLCYHGGRGPAGGRAVCGRARHGARARQRGECGPGASDHHGRHARGHPGLHQPRGIQRRRRRGERRGPAPPSAVP